MRTKAIPEQQGVIDRQQKQREALKAQYTSYAIQLQELIDMQQIKEAGKTNTPALQASR